MDPLEVVSTQSFFTLQELKNLVKQVGIEKIHKNALNALNELLFDTGTSIVKLALENNPKDVEINSTMISNAYNHLVSLKTPKIHYLWVINENGTCLFSARFMMGKAFPDAIFTGLILGMVVMMKEVTGRELEQITFQDLTLSLQEIPPILCVAISDQNEKILPLVKLLGEEFKKQFTTYLDKAGIDLNVFNSFEHDAKRIIMNWTLNKNKSDKITQESQILDPEGIQKSVMSQVARDQITNAINELKQLPLFQEEKPELDSTHIDLLIEKRLNKKPKPHEKKIPRSIKDILNEPDNDPQEET